MKKSIKKLCTNSFILRCQRHFPIRYWYNFKASLRVAKNLKSAPSLTTSHKRYSIVCSAESRGEGTGFTLAEVLITLGIIGVVAALTLPSVISKINKKHYTVALKRVYSTLSQALLLSEQEHGDASGWPWAPYHKEGLLEWTDEYIFKYIPKVVSCEQAPSKKCPAAESVMCRQVNNKETCDRFDNLYSSIYLLNSGELLYMYMGGNPVDEKSNYMHILVDLNGNKKPNTFGKDIFQFGLGLNRNTNYEKRLLNPYPYDVQADRTTMKRKCAENTGYCNQLIFYDNFEFLDDYPW